jgi:hypothetical protein
MRWSGSGGGVVPGDGVPDGVLVAGDDRLHQVGVDLVAVGAVVGGRGVLVVEAGGRGVEVPQGAGVDRPRHPVRADGGDPLVQRPVGAQEAVPVRGGAQLLQQAPEIAGVPFGPVVRGADVDEHLEVVAQLDGVGDGPRLLRDAEQRVPQPHHRTAIGDEQAPAAPRSDLQHTSVAQQPNRLADGGVGEAGLRPEGVDRADGSPR